MRNAAGKKSLFITILFTLILVPVLQLSANPLRVLKEKTLDVNKGELLEIQTDVGDVDIKTWNSNKVHVKILGNSKAEDKMNFEIKKTSRGVLLDGEKEGNSFWGWNNINVRYEIKVPAEFDVDISTAGGDINLVDLTGGVQLKTSGGDIIGDNIKGSLIAKTSGGDIKLSAIFGNIESSTSGGDITVGGSEGKLDVSTSGGDIVLKYKGQNKGIKASTSGGDIVVAIPSNFKADVYLKTSGGDVDCNFEAKVEEVSDSKFIGKLDGGGPDLICKTSGGDIKVRELN